MKLSQEIQDLYVEQIKQVFKSYIFKEIAQNVPNYPNVIQVESFNVEEYIEKEIQNKCFNSLFDFMAALKKIQIKLKDGHLGFLLHNDFPAKIDF